MVFDADFVGMAALPPKGDAISVVDWDAVSPGELPLELIKSIARWNPETSEVKRDIERLELPLHDAPQAARYLPQKTCVARAKEINGGLVAERLGHGRSLHTTQELCSH